MRTFLLLIFAFVFFGFGGAASAGDEPPSRVGRVSLVEGTVDFRPAGGEWSNATVNLPVYTGAALRTDKEERTELRIAGGRIALAPGTELELVRLDDGITELALRRGRVGIEIARTAADETIQIDLPRGGVWLRAAGQYEIGSGAGNEPTRIAVFEGDARFVGGGQDSAIAAGSAALLNGSNEAARIEAAAADSFGEWWRARGSEGQVLTALLHLSPEIAGIDALDAAGHWEAVPSHGAVWFADAAPDDWAPYRYGRWRWIGPWGWTWIDDAAWGFATSHYGRWARLPGANPDSERWGWVPGAPVDHPVYSPALVAFIGTPTVGLSYPDGIGPAIAWFPLAPGEVYWPGYTKDIDAIRRLNEGAVADLSVVRLNGNGEPPAEIVNAEYRNRRFGTAIPRSVFTASRAVAMALLAIPEQRLENAPMILGMRFPAAPTGRAPTVAAAPASGVMAPGVTAPIVVASVATAPARNIAVAAIARARAIQSAMARRNAPPGYLRMLAHALTTRGTAKATHTISTSRVAAPPPKPAAPARIHLAAARIVRR